MPELHARPIRVLQVVDTLSMGGAETWIMEVLRHAHRHALPLQCDVLATSGQPGCFDDEVRALGGTVHYLPFRKSSLYSFAKRFREILRQENYDVVHDHAGPLAGIHLALASGYLPRVRVVHLHNQREQFATSYGASILRRALLAISWRLAEQLGTAVRATSHAVLDSFPPSAILRSGATREALYCGFDPARFQGDPAAARHALCAEFGWPRDARIVLFAGRIDAVPDRGHPLGQKNAPLAVDVGIVLAKGDSIRMVLAGAPSPAVPALNQRIADAGLQGRIVFAGVRSDIEQLMLASHVLLFPSVVEGLGMAAVEAQAAGLTIVASDAVPRECNVVAGAVEHIPVDAPVEHWAAAVRRRLEAPRVSPDQANGEVARSPFSLRHSVDALMALYTDRL